VIRFGVVLSVVLVAIGLLVTGVVAGNLLLVAISIGVAVLAFLMLIGVVISYRQEIFGRPVPAGARPASAAPHSTVPAKATVGGGERDSKQKATGGRTRAPDAEPVTQAPGRAEAPAATAVPDKSAGRAAPGTAAAVAARTARSGRPGRDGPGTEPAAPSKDRSAPAAVKHEDRAEPHRASRLERESARAAVARATASSSADPAAGDRTADAKPHSPSEAGSPSEAAPGAESQSATRSAGGARGEQKPGKPDEPKPAKAASAAGLATPTAGSAAGTPAAADRSKPSAGPPAAADRSKPSADTPESGPSPQAPASEPPASPDSVEVSVVPGITRYHRSDCLLIRFLSAEDLEVMTRRAATDSGCVPCKACKPDQQTADLPVG
jgi:hypothetical protein